MCLKGEPELSPPRPTPGVHLRKDVRTIQEVRTTVTRIITDVYYDDGREVDRKVTEVRTRLLIASHVKCIFSLWSITFPCFTVQVLSFNVMFSLILNYGITESIMVSFNMHKAV